MRKFLRKLNSCAQTCWFYLRKLILYFSRPRDNKRGCKRVFVTCRIEMVDFEWNSFNDRYEWSIILWSTRYYLHACFLFIIYFVNFSSSKYFCSFFFFNRHAFFFLSKIKEKEENTENIRQLYRQLLRVISRLDYYLNYYVIK